MEYISAGILPLINDLHAFQPQSYDLKSQSKWSVKKRSSNKWNLYLLLKASAHKNQTSHLPLFFSEYLNLQTIPSPKMIENLEKETIYAILTRRRDRCKPYSSVISPYGKFVCSSMQNDYMSFILEGRCQSFDIYFFNNYFGLHFHFVVFWISNIKKLWKD